MKDMTVIQWHPNGQKKSETNYKNDKRVGLCAEWYESGKKQLEGNFKDDKQDGFWTEFDPNGQKWIERNYKGGEQYGLETHWEMNGVQSVQKEVHQDKMKRFNVDIPVSLHKAMKSQAAKHGLNLNTLTIDLFTKYLQKKAE